MTTPRVTVPVDGAEVTITLTGKVSDTMPDRPGWFRVTGHKFIFSATGDDAAIRLSAAPVREEGGAVRYRHKKRGTEYTLIGVGRAQGELQDDDPVVLYRGDDGGLWVRHQVEFCDGRFEQVSALATREESPAETGDGVKRTASGETVLGFKVAAWQYLGPSDDGDAKCGHRYCEHWSTVGNHPKKVVRLFTEDQLRSALRAQPPAREDAQPVAWRCSREWTSDGLGKWQYHDGPPNPSHLARNVQALFLHPAPDALRVAVEAFGVITDLSVNLRQGGPDSSDLNDLSDALNTAVDVAHEALAALADLQQENKP